MLKLIQNHTSQVLKRLNLENELKSLSDLTSSHQKHLHDLETELKSATKDIASLKCKPRV